MGCLCSLYFCFVTSTFATRKRIDYFDPQLKCSRQSHRTACARAKFSSGFISRTCTCIRCTPTYARCIIRSPSKAEWLCVSGSVVRFPLSHICSLRESNKHSMESILCAYCLSRKHYQSSFEWAAFHLEDSIMCVPPVWPRSASIRTTKRNGKIRAHWLGAGKLNAREQTATNDKQCGIWENRNTGILLPLIVS